jgi:hypothetical protein
MTKKPFEEITTGDIIDVSGCSRGKRIVIGPGTYDSAYHLVEHVSDNRILYRLILNSKMPGYTLDSFTNQVGS